MMIKTDDLIASSYSISMKSKKLEQKTKYYSKSRTDRKMDTKIDICNCFMNELNLPKHYRKEIIYLIKHEFKDFNYLHRKLSNEQIISLIIFYVMKKYNNNINFNDYSLFKRNNLRYRHLISFLTKLSTHYQEKSLNKIILKY